MNFNCFTFQNVSTRRFKMTYAAGIVCMSVRKRCPKQETWSRKCVMRPWSLLAATAVTLGSWAEKAMACTYTSPMPSLSGTEYGGLIRFIHWIISHSLQRTFQSSTSVCDLKIGVKSGNFMIRSFENTPRPSTIADTLPKACQSSPSQWPLLLLPPRGLGEARARGRQSRSMPVVWQAPQQTSPTRPTKQAWEERMNCTEREI